MTFSLRNTLIFANNWGKMDSFLCESWKVPRVAVPCSSSAIFVLENLEKGSPNFISVGELRWSWSSSVPVSIRDRPIYRSTGIIGRYLTFWISAGIRISTDILGCLSTAQFVPNSSWFSKNLRIYWNLFNKIFHVLPILFANRFHVLFCTFCLIKLVLFH